MEDQEQQNCADCKKKAAMFTALGIVAGAALGILVFKQVVKRGR